MGISSDEALRQAFKLIESGDFSGAADIFNAVLASDLDNDNFVLAVQICKFWADAPAFLTGERGFEQGELLLNRWKKFSSIVRRISEEDFREHISYACRKKVFSVALECYNTVQDKGDNLFLSETLRKKGLCYKKLGSYETALEFLQKANSAFANRSCVLAEMADSYELCGEMWYSKLLFREAFFIEAEKIDLSFLDSHIIQNLAEEVRSIGYPEDALNEWIAVYGVLRGVFNVKRELKEQEVIRLRQDIFSKENEWKDPKRNRSSIKPRLLNLYFWLIDHYVTSKESSKKIEETMLSMRILDEKIYEMYR